jgi:phosphohistidine phosphatase
MDLILWRHAEAEDGKPDLQRELTEKGRKQAAEVAAWLLERLPNDFVVVSSPAARAMQTAQALGRDVKTDRTLAPGAPVQAIVRAAGWPAGDGTIFLVGHQPDFGAALAHLVAGKQADWSLEKGGLWWLTGQPVRVRAVLSPDLLL